MSSGIVRAQFRAELLAGFPAVEYAETIATRVANNTLDNLWQSLEFIGERDAPIGIGRPTCCRESGIVRVVAFAISGQGDGAAITHLDAVAAHFRGYDSNGVRVLEMTPPFTSPESVGRWLQSSIDLRYQRDYTA